MLDDVTVMCGIEHGVDIELFVISTSETRIQVIQSPACLDFARDQCQK